MAFSTGCHGDMQMKLKTLSSFSENLQYNRGTRCRWKDIITHAKTTWKQVQINVTQNISAKRNGIMEWSVCVQLFKWSWWRNFILNGCLIEAQKWIKRQIVERIFYSESMARPLENKGVEERASNSIWLLKDRKLVPK